MRKITIEDIHRTQRPSEWDFGNDILYRLCRDYPRHTKTDEIIAKVWLIGRSYSAAIERRRNSTQTGDDFYTSTVGPEMKAARIDLWFKKLPCDDPPGCAASIEIHWKMLDLFHEITKLHKRSLASKYLHFHYPSVFFLYDSRAAHGIARLAPRAGSTPEIQPEVFDDAYMSFVRRCVWLREHIYKTYGVLLTPREIDKLLLAIADERRKPR